MGTQVEIAARIVSHGADYLLPLKGNQPTLAADVEAYFRTDPASELVSKTTVEKGCLRRIAKLMQAALPLPPLWQIWKVMYTQS